MKDVYDVDSYQLVNLFERPMLYTEERIDRDSVPYELYHYELKGSDVDPGRYASIEEDFVSRNYTGCVLSLAEIDFRGRGYADIEDMIDFTGVEYEDLDRFIDDFDSRENAELIDPFIYD